MTTEEFVIRISLVVAVLAVALGAVACDPGEPGAGAPTHSRPVPVTGDDTGEAPETVTEEELVGLAAGPDGWVLKVNRRGMGTPFFADFVGPHTAQWVEASWTSWWSESDQGPNVLISVFRFDSADHAEQVWRDLRSIPEIDERYTIEGIEDTYVAVSDVPDLPATLHEAYRLVDRHLVVFALPQGTETERPDPTLEQVVRHHADEVTPGAG